MEIDQCIKTLGSLVHQDFPGVLEMISRSTGALHEQNSSTTTITTKLQDMKKKTESVIDMLQSVKANFQEMEYQLKKLQKIPLQSDISTLESASRNEDETFTKPVDEVGQNIPQNNVEEHPRWQLDWKNEEKMSLPFSMSRNIQAVIVNQMLYIGAGDAERVDIENEFKVMSCNLTSQHWENIQYIAKWFAMVVIDNKLTLIGGRDKDRRDVNTLGVLNNDSWTNPYPPMPTSRSHCSAASYKVYLIVAGGTTVDLDTLSVIEILNLDTMQWQQVCDASIPFYSMKSVILNDTWYLMGGYHGHDVTHDVFAVKLDDLVANHESQRTWTHLPELRCYHSSPILVRGKLLAVGGRASAYKSVDTIYLYDCHEQKWSLAGRLPCAINNCACVIISNAIHIFGGYDGTNRRTSIYMCSFEEHFCS